MKKRQWQFLNRRLSVIEARLVVIQEFIDRIPTDEVKSWLTNGLENNPPAEEQAIPGEEADNPESSRMSDDEALAKFKSYLEAHFCQVVNNPWRQWSPEALAAMAKVLEKNGYVDATCNLMDERTIWSPEALIAMARILDRQCPLDCAQSRQDALHASSGAN